MKKTKILFAFSFFFSSLLYACPVGHKSLSKKQHAALEKLLGKQKSKRQKRDAASLMKALPTAQSKEPWGGPDANRWKPEAILANATSRGLNEGWKHDAKEVLVSVPVRMKYTNERVYGDGQTNATLGFGEGWNEKEPQLVATLVKFKDGNRKLFLRFSEKLNLKDPKVSMTSFVPGSNKKISQTVSLVQKDGAYQGEWQIPAEVAFGDLNNSRVTWVRPAGWDGVFPIDFRMPIYTTTELIKAAGNAKTAGRPAMDPMDVQNRSRESGDIPMQTLLKLKSSFGPEWQSPFGGMELPVASVHGEVHLDGRETKTAVGGGHTWLVDKNQHSNFKNLYTCFDARNYEAEKKFGVPSGGGWHEIGDAAETIINSVEQIAAVVGFATGVPWPTPPDGGKFAWNLTDVATIRILLPEEAVMTPAGDQTWKEDEPFRRTHDPSQAKDRGAEPSGGGRNYHWFYFPTDTDVCTQEWVHPYRPTEKNGFGLLHE